MVHLSSTGALDHQHGTVRLKAALSELKTTQPMLVATLHATAEAPDLMHVTATGMNGSCLTTVYADPADSPTRLRDAIRERLDLTPRRRLMLIQPNGKLLEDNAPGGVRSLLATFDCFAT